MKRICIVSACLVFLAVTVQATVKDFPSGPLATEPAFFQYAVYLIEPVKEDPYKLAEKIYKEKYSHFKQTKTPDLKQSSLRIQVLRNVSTEYPPPGLESLRYFGEGLSKEQAEKLQKAEKAIVVDFSVPVKNRVTGLVDASGLIADISEATHGVIWDEETRQCFDHATWLTDRVNAFENGIPDISKHTVIHAYKDGDYIRAISLGMAKFSLPDIEVSDFSWSDNRNVGNLVNVFAQLLFDTGTIKEAGKFVINIDRIKHQTVRKETKESLFEHAEQEVPIHIVQGQRDEGDPDNRIIEIVFDNYPGKDKIEKMGCMLSKLWGREDEIVHVKHNEEILAASQRAKLKLPAIRECIQNGLAPGEYYMVKAPFATPDGGDEWMWVEVISWKDTDKVSGILRNQPFNIPTLKAGSQVIVRADDIFDYIHRASDGTSDGNETGKLIEKYSE